MQNLISNDLYAAIRALQISSTSRFSELTAVDNAAVASVAEQVDGEFQRLLDRVRRELSNEGSVVAQRHDRWLRVNRKRVRQQFIQGVAQSTPSCLCLPLFFENETSGEADSVCVGSCVENMANIDSGSNVAHPRLEVHGPGPGGTNTAQTTVRFEFTIEPGGGGEYCILPVCQLSGHWLTWTWGSCDVDAAGSQAQISVEKTIEVTQLDDGVDFPLLLQPGGASEYSLTHTVVDHIETDGSNNQAGFSFDGSPAFRVNLIGSDPVVVRIICRVQAHVEGFGRAIVDMNTSPNFYFRAPEVVWGPTLCLA